MAVLNPSLHQHLQADLQERLGPDAAVVCTGVDGDPETLWSEERAVIARAVPKRQREFAAGRSAARSAMQRLNWRATSIPSHADRSPCWPEGLVGSIAHTADTCIAVVGRRNPWVSIGIDIEPDRGIDESLWGIICTSDELQQLDELASASKALLVTRVFVAKEAFYKWHYPQHRTFLDFQDFSVKLEPNGPDFEIIPQPFCRDERLLGPGRGQVFVVGGYVAACMASRVQDHRYNSGTLRPM